LKDEVLLNQVLHAAKAKNELTFMHSFMCDELQNGNGKAKLN